MPIIIAPTPLQGRETKPDKKHMHMNGVVNNTERIIFSVSIHIGINLLLIVPDNFRIISINNFAKLAEHYFYCLPGPSLWPLAPIY